MGSHESHPWTVSGLIGAFIDLALAYFLLCASTFMFFASKFVSIVGLDLPCPCNGFFGYRNDNFCWHKLLIDWPIRKIYAIQMCAKSRFPFDLVWFRNESNSSKKLNRDMSCENGFVELENEEVCSSSFSSSRNQNLVDRESGCDAKGKRVMNVKQRPGIRRRRRATLGYGRFAYVFPNESFPSIASVLNTSCDYREMKDQYAEGLGPLSGREDGPQDDENAPIGNYKGGVTCHSFELSGSFSDSNSTIKHSTCSEKYIKDDTEEKRPVVGSESDTIRRLERALEEERAACAALYIELEKERAAAATAADEAMAMISRLQKDKASMEIEARQCQRMIEEKFAYDEEEIDILKEILIRRERENHFLEKEIETYRHMSLTGDEQSQGNFSDTLDEWGQRPLSSLFPIRDPQLILHKTVNTKSGYDNMQSDADFSSSHEIPIVEEQSHSNGHDLIEKTVLLVGKEKEQDSVICHKVIAEVPCACNDDEKTLYCDGEELLQNGKHHNHVD
ncbi:Zein-binding domain containing protein [Parasponia andersonii]|uniref:Zein-binding domain containing protein n=1 Tax=Parasponia andersonii TaxID=3476 RepID=A0A2P5DBZ3_PARAD|nr:Zein-binding domain containing protein [Parasponia andersonii]